MPDMGRETTGGGKVKHAAINAIRRPLNLLRRAGSGEKVPTASKDRRRASASDSVYESDEAQSSNRPSESRDRAAAADRYPSLPSPVPSSLDSLHAQPPKLNSSSPASELPKSCVNPTFVRLPGNIACSSPVQRARFVDSYITRRWSEWNWAYQNGMIGEPCSDTLPGSETRRLIRFQSRRL